MHKISLVGLFCMVFLNAIAQNDEMVANLAKKTPPILLGSTTEQICGSQLSYLGEVKQSEEKTYRVATFYILLGDSCRRITRLLVYDKALEYLGNYYTHGVLPVSIDGSKLTGEDFPETDFSTGLPDSIQIAKNQWAKFEKK